MQKKSAGILLYRLTNSYLEVLLVHPGGPYWAKKDLGSWTIPKGEFTDEEDPLHAAKREFKEETGADILGDELIQLSPIKQKGGKLVYAWAFQGDIDSNQIKSNIFELEWPPKTGKKQLFPEIDKGEWFDILGARQKIIPSQLAMIDELISKLNLSDEQIFKSRFKTTTIFQKVDC